MKNPLIDESLDVSIYLDNSKREFCNLKTEVNISHGGMEMVVRREVATRFETPQIFIVKIDSPLKYRMEKAINQIL